MSESAFLQTMPSGAPVFSLCTCVREGATMVKPTNKRIACRRACALLLGILAITPNVAKADQGGAGFYLPGSFGSLAAVPGEPGWSWATIYLHTTVLAGANQQFELGGGRNLNVVTGLQAQGDLALFGPTYVFATPVLGGQASVSVLGYAGRNQASISATLTGPLGNTVSGSASQALTSVGDVIPQVALKWNAGVHNYMVYAQGDIPVGDYDATRLANAGLGHGAIDAGGGYTYFNPQTGIEASAVLGMTYNFRNPDNGYQNGVDGHLDYAVSKFWTKQFFTGMVGYIFQQVSGDTGGRLGANESRVLGLGPQIGYIFPLGESQGYLNLKVYKEFEAVNRAEGWNLWLTFAISPAARPSESSRPMLTK
jgi:hypothetical protein